MDGKLTNLSRLTRRALKMLQEERGDEAEKMAS